MENKIIIIKNKNLSKPASFSNASTAGSNYGRT